ncbi:MAG: tRNA pseudouridine(38-40) synthase TruA [Deltaproteobacteria bacterium]|nr:tRNA pseudouridine(38-40) synthase TruA [Deltaproteobacteria bacterium]
MHYRLVVEYDGTDLHGWQLQPNARTVQGELEAAVAQLFGEPTRVTAAGRTDAGVHASGQVVSFHAERALSPDVVCRALNAHTAADVAVRQVDVVDDAFDPRRHARSRRYVYRIWNRRVPSPFWRRYAWHVPQPLDVAEMARAAAELLGEHDFSSFRAAGCDAAHPVRRVLRSIVEADGALLRYEIEATAFLRHMVRNIVGTLVEIGLGRRAADLTALLAARDRSLAAATAPAAGLCLVEVRY